MHGSPFSNQTQVSYGLYTDRVRLVSKEIRGLAWCDAKSWWCRSDAKVVRALNSSLGNKIRPSKVRYSRSKDGFLDDLIIGHPLSSEEGYCLFSTRTHFSHSCEPLDGLSRSYVDRNVFSTSCYVTYLTCQSEESTEYMHISHVHGDFNPLNPPVQDTSSYSTTVR